MSRKANWCDGHLTNTCSSFTRAVSGNEVLMVGNGPLIPRFERNDTFHSIDARARYVPVRRVCDADRYVYMHGDTAVSLSRGVHGRPGPAQRTGSFPSPGEYTRR